METKEIFERSRQEILMLREQIIAEIMKLVGPRRVPMDHKPSIDEIEKMLNSDNPQRIQILPDGSAMIQAGAHTVGDIADAVLRIIAPEKLPDRESFWLVERLISPPQYVSLNSAGWHSDPWEARRFKSERDAHDYWRMMGEVDRPQFKVVEHLFINKMPSTPSQLAETSKFMADNGLRSSNYGR